MHVVDDCDKVGYVLSMTCGVEGCEGVVVLCSSCGVVGCGIPFGSAGSVLVFVGGIGGGEREAETAVELEASSSVTVTSGDFEALRAFEEVAFLLPPDLPLAKGPYCSEFIEGTGYETRQTSKRDLFVGVLT